MHQINFVMCVSDFIMKSLTKTLTKAYILYFGYQVGNQDKS